MVSSTRQEESFGKTLPQPPLVLLVDDDEDQLMLFSTILERSNCAIVTASSGLEALEVLKQIHVDLVVCDVFMPQMNGKEFIEEVRRAEDLVSLPIIAFSANPELVVDMEGAGADLFFPKSKVRSLLGEVSRLVNDQAANGELLARIRARYTH